jgi:large conductance mechanosensitive channel
VRGERLEKNKEDQMLIELRKIREAVEKGPPPTPPKGLWNEFRDFLKKYGVLGLAVAFVLGLYLGGVVQALVKDLLMPAIGLIIPNMQDLASYVVPVMNQKFGIGDFLVAVITFLIVALVVFIIVKIAKRWHID